MMATTKLQQQPLIFCGVARLGVAGVNALDVVYNANYLLALCRGLVVKRFHCFLECYSMRASKQGGQLRGETAYPLKRVSSKSLLRIAVFYIKVIWN